jgi:hypothetical protein
MGLAASVLIGGGCSQQQNQLNGVSDPGGYGHVNNSTHLAGSHPHKGYPVQTPSVAVTTIPHPGAPQTAGYYQPIGHVGSAPAAQVCDGYPMQSAGYPVPGSYFAQPAGYNHVQSSTYLPGVPQPAVYYESDGGALPGQASQFRDGYSTHSAAYPVGYNHAQVTSTLPGDSKPAGYCPVQGQLPSAAALGHGGYPTQQPGYYLPGCYLAQPVGCYPPQGSVPSGFAPSPEGGASVGYYQAQAPASMVSYPTTGVVYVEPGPNYRPTPGAQDLGGRW